MVQCPVCHSYKKSVELKPLKVKINKRYYACMQCPTCYNNFLYVWEIGKHLEDWINRSFDPPEGKNKLYYDLNKILETLGGCFMTLDIEGYLPIIPTIVYYRGKISYQPIKEVKNVLIPVSSTPLQIYRLAVYGKLEDACMHGHLLQESFDSMPKLFKHFDEHNLSNDLVVELL